ncbi:MAG: DUF3857 domain-containing protein [Bacteroidota bacterium]
MKLHILSIWNLWLFCLLASSPSQANNKPEYAVSLIPPALLINVDAVVRSRSVEFDIKSLTEFQERHRLVVTIFNANSDLDELIQHYDNSTKLGKSRAVIYDEEGREIRKVSRKEIRDYGAVDGFSLYSDSRVRHLPVKYSRYPYTIEFEYSSTHSKSPFYPIWYIQSYRTSVQSATYKVIHPEDFSFRFKLENIDIEPTTQSDGNKKTTQWTFENLMTILNEQYAPPPSEVLPMLILAPNAFTMGQYRGEMDSWKNYGLFMNRLNGEADNMSEAMVQEVKALTQHAKTDKEKIAILYKYLQKNMRYVSVQLGIGGWQAYDAQYVEKNKYGDCKALTWFMKSMLDKIGIKAYPTLCKSGYLNYEVEQAFVTPRFNHVFLHIPAENYWLECTSKDNPVNYLGEWSADRNVLMLTEEGGQLSRTPAYTGRDNMMQNKAVLNISAEGAASIENNILLTGPKQEYYRAYHTNKSESDFRRWFLSNQLEGLPTVDLKQLKVQIDQDYPTATVAYQLEVARYASKAGKRIFLPLNCLNNFNQVPPADNHRLHPIVVQDSYYEKDDFTISLPEGFRIESMPEEEKVLDTPYGSYKVWIEKNEDSRELKYHRELNILPVELPASDYQDFRNFYKEIAKLDKMKVVLVKEKT